MPFKKGQVSLRRGVHLSEEIRKKISLAKIGSVPWNKGKIGVMPTGKENHAWKAENVGYRGLHYWVERNLGKARVCEFCGKEKTTPKSIHWANKGHQYKRELTDWLQLCVSCHKNYDSSFRQKALIHQLLYK